jgi:hypothetical protein
MGDDEGAVPPGAVIEYAEPVAGDTCMVIVSFEQHLDTEADTPDPDEEVPHIPPTPNYCENLAVIRFRLIQPPRGKVTAWLARCSSHLPADDTLPPGGAIT